jgi:hypothetical protein
LAFGWGCATEATGFGFPIKVDILSAEGYFGGLVGQDMQSKGYFGRLVGQEVDVCASCVTPILCLAVSALAFFH